MYYRSLIGLIFVSIPTILIVSYSSFSEQKNFPKTNKGGATLRTLLHS